MAAPRLRHSQTLLADGRVLVAMGIRGGAIVASSGTPGQIPVFTASCEVFDPAALAFVATADFAVLASPIDEYQSPRAFHGASMLPGGGVLITSGFRQGFGLTPAAVPSGYCAVWN